MGCERSRAPVVLGLERTVTRPTIRGLRAASPARAKDRHRLPCILAFMNSSGALAVPVWGGEYEHTIDFHWRRGGLALRYEARPVVSLFESILRTRDFAIAEFSLSNYLMLRDRGEDWLVALPIFPYRAFRHSALYVRSDSANRAPRDLVGKRIGLSDVSMTAAVLGPWHPAGGVRSRLAHDDVAHEWSTALRSATVPTRLGTRSTRCGCAAPGHGGRSHSGSPPAHRSGPEAGALRRLFADAQREEQAYFRRTAIYPIMHVVVVHRDVLDAHSDVVAAAMAAYESAKRSALSRRLSAGLLPWGKLAWQEVDREFDGDPLPYGLTPRNRKVIDKLQGYLLDQGLVRQRHELDVLFAAVPASAEDRRADGY